MNRPTNQRQTTATLTSFSTNASLQRKQGRQKQTKERKQAKQSKTPSSSLASPNQCRFCIGDRSLDSLSTLYQMKRAWSSSPDQSGRSYNAPMSILVGHSLYEKYSSSLMYFYSRDVNDILRGERCHKVIKFKYLVDFENESSPMIQKFYNLGTSYAKLPVLTEYYKYHNPIPRLFMHPISQIVNRMHDKKRKLDYWKIVRRIEEENKLNPHKPPKAIVGDRPIKKNQSSESESQSRFPYQERIFDKILDSRILELRQPSDQKQSHQLPINAQQYHQQPQQPLRQQPLLQQQQSVQVIEQPKQQQQTWSYKKRIHLDDVALQQEITSRPNQYPVSARNSQQFTPLSIRAPQTTTSKPSAQKFIQQVLTLNLDSLKQQQLHHIKYDLLQGMMERSPRDQPLETPKGTPRGTPRNRGITKGQPFFQVPGQCAQYQGSHQKSGRRTRSVNTDNRISMSMMSQNSRASNLSNRPSIQDRVGNSKHRNQTQHFIYQVRSLVITHPEAIQEVDPLASPQPCVTGGQCKDNRKTSVPRAKKKFMNTTLPIYGRKSIFVGLIYYSFITVPILVIPFFLSTAIYYGLFFIILIKMPNEAMNAIDAKARISLTFHQRVAPPSPPELVDLRSRFVFLLDY